MSCRPIPLGFGIFLILVGIYHGGSVSPDTSNYRAPEENDPDRQRKPERDCLGISVMSCRPMPLVPGMFLISVSIYKGGSVSRDTTICRTPQVSVPDRQRKLARLSGNRSYFFPPRPSRIRDFHDPCWHLPGRFFFSRYIEL